jgi:hypothetical protein
MGMRREVDLSGGKCAGESGDDESGGEKAGDRGCIGTSTSRHKGRLLTLAGTEPNLIVLALIAMKLQKQGDPFDDPGRDEVQVTDNPLTPGNGCVNSRQSWSDTGEEASYGAPSGGMIENDLSGNVRLP